MSASVLLFSRFFFLTTRTALEPVGAIFIKVDKAAVDVINHLFGVDFSLLDSFFDLVVDHKFDVFDGLKLNVGDVLRLSILLTNKTMNNRVSTSTRPD